MCPGTVFMQLTVKPSSGRIAAEETLDLEVAFTAPCPGVLMSTLVLEMRGGNVVRLPFRADAVLPNVEVDQVRSAC